MARLSRKPVLPSQTSAEPKQRRYGDAEDRARRVRAQRLALLTIASGVLYILWVWRTVDWTHPVVAAAFLLAETASLVLFAMAAAGAWRLRFKPAEAILQPLPESVDVLIPVSGEPIEVVARTIEAATRIVWPGPLHISVLDDSGSSEVEAVARRWGVVYRSRRREQLPVTDGKAGNLNFGLSATSGTYVLTLDADQVPVPVIVEKLAPYLTLPKVAFVQSKQSFNASNDDPFSADNPVFHSTLQQAFDAHDTVLSCGSGVLYRRAALDTIGGFITWNVVEDLTTSYELHSRGWKSLYYPYALSSRPAPETLLGIFRQRSEWALDTLRLLFWRCPLMRRTLSWQKRLNYFIIGFSYLVAGFVAPLFFLIPVWSYLTGGSLLSGHEASFALWRSLYFVAMMLAVRWMFRGHHPGRQFQMLVGLFPIYILSAANALRYRNHKPATSAVGVAPRLPLLVALAPQLLLLAANVFGPFYALLTETPLHVIAASMPVSALAIWSLSQVCCAALTRGQWSPDRHPVRFYAPVVETEL